MIRVGRQPQVVEYSARTGDVISLHEETWWVLLAYRWGGGVVAYRRPRFVESIGTRVPIHDVIGIARVMALGIVLATSLLRRFKQ
jgi:hypothetical protein